jgi:PAS domain S-box-containing protein
VEALVSERIFTLGTRRELGKRKASIGDVQRIIYNYRQPGMPNKAEREAPLDINMAALTSQSNSSSLPSSQDAPSNKASHAALDSDIEQHEDEYCRPLSPLHLPGQIDGLESLKADRFTNGRGQSPHRRDSNSSILHLHIPRIPSPAQIAFTAMQYLPYPMMVLNGLKTLALANEAMGRLLGIEDLEGDTASDDGTVALDRLKGQTLSQMGIDMLQDGRPVWVTWESFLESIAEGMGTNVEEDPVNLGSENGEGDVTPTAERVESLGRRTSSSKNKSVVHDAVVEVVLTPPEISASYFAKASNNNVPKHTFAKMIITVWEIEDDKFFTLTFTSTDSAQTSLPSSRGNPRQVTKSTTHRSLGSTGSGSASHSSPSSVSSGRSSNQGGSSNSSAITSPTYASMSGSPFPPLGPPSSHAASSSPSSLQKVIMMKEALLDNTETPILAMWKDGSLTIPNRAARRLFHPAADLTVVKDGRDLVSKWQLWDETFTTQLGPSEYPISVIVKTQTPFSSRKFGIIDPETGRRIVFDALGEAIRDVNTGEFLAGMVTCRDITKMTEQINEIKEKDEQRFQLICDSMPQMIWTTTPEGMHDWFSQRWYDYTGLTEEESLGMGWQLPFHPEDMQATGKRWQHSLSTGAPYSTEYRCRNKDGKWRWMLGRALPLRNNQTGVIEKWFGTCTDIHEAVEARFAQKRMVS